MKHRINLSLFVVLGIMIISWSAIQIYSIGSMPKGWYDEVAILENVRGGLFAKPLKFSMCLQSVDPSITQPRPLYYVGDLVQNMAYDVFGLQGPRIASLLSLIVLTIAGMVYSHSTRHSRVFTIIFGIIIFGCPYFISSAAASRVDCWAIAILFFALSLLEFMRGKSRAWLDASFLLYGFLSVLSIFVWFTSVFFAPIYLWAILNASDRKVRDIILTAFCATVAVMVLLCPFWREFHSAFAFFAQMLTGISGSSFSYMSRAEACCCFFRLLIGLPGVAALGIGLLFLTRRTVLLKIGVCLFFVVTVLICSRMYGCRFTYLIPFALLGILQYDKTIVGSKWLIRGLIVLVAVVSFARGTAVSILAAWIESRSRDSGALVKRELDRTVGRDIKVYCDTYQLYFIGRELGWKAYRMDERWTLSDFDFDKFGVNCFVTETSFVSDRVRDLLAKYGFKSSFEINVPELELSDWMRHRLFNVCRGHQWGPYVVYLR